VLAGRDDDAADASRRERRDGQRERTPVRDDQRRPHVDDQRSGRAGTTMRAGGVRAVHRHGEPKRRGDAASRVFVFVLAKRRHERLRRDPNPGSSRARIPHRVVPRVAEEPDRPDAGARRAPARVQRHELQARRDARVGVEDARRRPRRRDTTRDGRAVRVAHDGEPQRAGERVGEHRGRASHEAPRRHAILKRVHARGGRDVRVALGGDGDELSAAARQPRAFADGAPQPARGHGPRRGGGHDPEEARLLPTKIERRIERPTRFGLCF
jgi:hypothetical protein